MTKCRIPTVRVYVRERGGKRSFYPAPRIPDPTACYWLRYEKDGKQFPKRVGHYDLVAREKLLLERRLSAEAQGFIIPEDQAAEKASGSRVTIRSAVDAYLESLRIKNRPKKTRSRIALWIWWGELAPQTSWVSPSETSTNWWRSTTCLKN